jgi:predicted PolB exonuclease-like 3'-5' exonuclease
MLPMVLDLATTILPDAESLIRADESIEAPSNYKDPVKIAAYIEQRRDELVAKAALDPDCCRISCLGVVLPDGLPRCVTNRTLDDESERTMLRDVNDKLNAGYCLITFNGARFDLPVLARRAMYLGVPLLLDTDRYKSPHVDVYERLTHFGKSTAHSLTWYARRFGWKDLAKPLDGAAEAMAPQRGQWDELVASNRHDLIATFRFAQRLGFITDRPADALEPDGEPLF